MFFKRMALVDFLKAMVAASHEPHAEEVRNIILPKLTTVECFVEHFAIHKSPAAVGAGTFDDPVVLDEDDEDLVSDQGLGTATAEAFDEFKKSLSPPGKCFSNLLSQMHCGVFDAEFLEISDAEIKSAAFTFAFANLFKGTAEDPVEGLKLPLIHGSCLKWLESTSAQPLPTDNASSSAIGDADRVLTMATDAGTEREDEKVRSKTIASLEEMLQKQVHMDHIPHCDYSPLTLTKAWSDHVKKRTTAGSAPKKPITMFLLCAELFPFHSQLHGPDTFRGIPTTCSPEFQHLINWVITAKQQADVVIIADGRSDMARDQIRTALKSAVDDDFTELWVLYNMETSLSTDVRNPKRKVAWSSANMETLFALLPAVAKGQRKMVARDLFTKSGESTNFSRSYSGVPFRNLLEIPRLTEEGKKQIMGQAAVGAFTKERVKREVEAKGHPLFWAEWKPVNLFSTLFRDFGITHVVDMTPGSGAACLAALYSEIPYTAFCHNEAHMQWLKGLINKVFVALVAQKDVTAQDEVVANVKHYLHRAVEAAKQMLPRNTANLEASFTGADDSDASE